jgi:hypothetical protein
MKNLSYKIGYYTAVSLSVLFVSWMVCFIGIAVTSPLFFWSGLADYLNYAEQNSQFLQHVAKALMLVFGPLFVVLINSFYEFAPKEKRFLVRLSLLFALGFALLSSLHYFVQLSAVRLNMVEGTTQGLDWFVQANPHSIMTSIDMLGWTLFLGATSFCLFPVFGKGKGEAVIRFAFLATGIFSMLAGIGYLFQIDILTFLCANLGVGGALLATMLSAARLFKRLRANER